MGKGFHLGGVHLSGNVFGLRFLGKYHRHVKILGDNTGDADAGRLNGQDLCHLRVREAAFEFLTDLAKQANVHLVVQKAVYFQHVSGLDLAVFPYSVF